MAALRQIEQTSPGLPHSGSMTRSPARAAATSPTALRMDLEALVGEDLVFDDSEAEFGALRQLSDHLHYAFDFAEHWAVGRGELCVLGEGVYVHIMDAELRAPHLMQVLGADVMRIRIASESCGEYAPPHGDPINFDGPGAAIIVEPAGQAPADAVFDGHNRSLQVYVHRSALRRLYGNGGMELPAVIQAFLDGSLQRTVVRSMPLSSALLRCLEDVLSCAQEGITRRLYIQSKAIEALCLAFDALRDDDGCGSADSSMITSRGVLKAQAILLERFVAPPSLDDLAHEVGLSRTSLSAGFRKILGQSVFDYIQDLRMQHALALLNERSASITQVAYAVGYNHASSFTVAVQRKFGASPRELRRRGALPGL